MSLNQQVIQRMLDAAIKWATFEILNIRDKEASRGKTKEMLSSFVKRYPWKPRYQVVFVDLERDLSWSFPNLTTCFSI